MCSIYKKRKETLSNLNIGQFLFSAYDLKLSIKQTLK